jgi:hypothetical protein
VQQHDVIKSSRAVSRVNSQLTRLTAREDFITSCRRESFKSHITHLYGENVNQEIKLLEKLRKKVN